MGKNFKKSLALMLCLVMMVASVPLSGFVGIDLGGILDFTASAVENDSGSCGDNGDNVTYTFDSTTGTLTIRGSGAMIGYAASNFMPWDSYRTSITSIVIERGVTSIGSSAFWECTNLTSVTIPDSVTSIGDVAFGLCESLTSITLPNSVTAIGMYAFRSCISLTSITIPDSVKSIGNYAFYYCTSLTSVTIPDLVTSIAYRAFSYCTSLISITIPDSVTSIGNFAFYNCSSLETVYYTGTQSQWDAISVGDDYNTYLTDATLILLEDDQSETVTPEETDPEETTPETEPEETEPEETTPETEPEETEPEETTPETEPEETTPEESTLEETAIETATIIVEFIFTNTVEQITVFLEALGLIEKDEIVENDTITSLMTTVQEVLVTTVQEVLVQMFNVLANFMG